MRALSLLLPLAGCTLPAAPIEIEAPDTVPADGVTRTTITARLNVPVAGAVVQWEIARGLLSSSATPIVDGTSTVVLTSIEERELGLRPQLALDVAARVVLSDDPDDVLAGSRPLAYTAPAEGPPFIVVAAEPPGADVGTDVTIRVMARRVTGRVAVTTSGGALASSEVELSPEGFGTTTLSGPAEPTTVVVRAGDAAAHVLFVAPGDPQYDLNGVFVQVGPARVRLTSGALAPNPQCAIAPSYVKVDFVQTGLDVAAVYTTCRVTFPPVASIAGTITNAASSSFYDAVPVVQASVRLPSPAIGAAYEPPASVVVAGAVLDDPANDALPTEPDDPRVRDDDGDGEPGVTVTNSLGGEQRIVYRNTGSARGLVRSSTRVEGASVGDLVAVTETSVFGVGGAFLPDVEGLPSVVEIVRIDGAYGAPDADADADGVVSCAEVADLAPSVALLQPPDTPFDCGGVE